MNRTKIAAVVLLVPLSLGGAALSFVACRVLSLKTPSTSMWENITQSWSASDIRESQRRGDEILDALDAYVAEHGELPAKLSQLVPKYLPQIRPPTAGTCEWRYRSFRLSEDRWYIPNAKALSAGFDCDLRFGFGQGLYPNSSASWARREWLVDE